MSDAVEAGVAEGGLRVGEVCDAQVSEDAEGQVESSDVEGGEGSEGAGAGLAEVGEQPEGTRGESGGEVVSEGVDFGLGEAVEEEMSGDEVDVGGGSEGEGGGLEGLEAIGGGVAAVAEEVEHGGTGIDSEGVEMGLVAHPVPDGAACRREGP